MSEALSRVDEGRRKVSEGCVNFATQLNDYTLVCAMRKDLLREGEGFYTTDLGGGLDGRSGTGKMHERILIYYSLLVDA